MNIDANLNDVEAWGGETVQLPPGEYQLKVKAADVESKEKDGVTKQQLVVDYEVASGAFSGKVAKAWFGLDFTKETPRKRLKSLVLACGIPVSTNGSFDTAQLVGCRLNADVQHDTVEGKTDPIDGSKQPDRTFIRIVNERTFREVAEAPQAATNAVNAPSGKPVSTGGMPGLSKQ